jgi:hypothetical protein
MGGSASTRGDFEGEEKAYEPRFRVGEPRDRARSATGSTPDGRFVCGGGLAQGTPGCTPQGGVSHGSSPGRPAGRGQEIGCPKVEGSNCEVGMAGAVEPGTVGARAEPAAEAAKFPSDKTESEVALESATVPAGDWTAERCSSSASATSAEGVAWD